MLSMALSHTTDDQSINGAMALCGEGAHMAFRLTRFTVKHARNRKKKNAEAAAEDTLTSDACSAYRGGYTSTNDPEIKTLLFDLGGFDETFGPDVERPFFWMGDKSDLSYFWKKTEWNTPVKLPRSVIDEIPDEALRRRVISTMTQARMEGLLTMDSDAYFLTDAGKSQILDTRFVKDRMQKECEYFSVAYAGLSDLREQMENDRIDKRLEELGRAGEFDGCDRITLNKEKLLVEDAAGDTIRFYIPGTARKQSVELPASDVIELDARTYAAFLRKDQQYLVNGKPMQEKELFGYFHDKNKKETERIATAAKRAEQAAIEAEMLQPDLKAGQKAYVLRPVDGELEVHEYTVERVSNSPDGNHLYRLHPNNPNYVDMLMRGEMYGRLFFKTAESAVKYAAIASEDVLAQCKQLEGLFTPKNYLRIPAKNVEQAGELILVHPKDAPHEAIAFKTDAAQLQQDGSAIVQLLPNTSYAVQSGEVSYAVSQKGAQQLLAGVSSPVNENAIVAAAAEKSSQTAKEAIAMQAQPAAKALAGTAAKATPLSAVQGARLVAEGARLITEITGQSPPDLPTPARILSLKP